MEIKIGKPIQPLKNEFLFRVGFMFGDADGYTTEEIAVNKDNPNLNRFIEFLETAEGREPHSLENYKYFEEDEDEAYENGKENVIILGWPREPSWGEYYASYQGYEVTFFDENGIEHEVKIK